MITHALAVSASALGASVAPASNAITDKEILDWCFVIGSLDLGVIGFLYSTYATAKFSDKDPPPITAFLKSFIRALTLVLCVLTGVAISTAYSASVQVAAWLIVGCLSFVTAWSIALAYRLD